MLIARGSATELEHWVRAAAARGLLEGDRYDATIEEAIKILNGLIRTERQA